MAKVRAGERRAADAVVIGAGPAGLTAAGQLMRQGIGTVVLEKEEPGGQVRTANIVENYPGMLGRTGKDIAREFVSHARSLKVRILKCEVRRVERDLRVETDRGTWRAKAVIAAPGAVPEMMGFGPSEAFGDLEHIERFRGKEVLILGGGDAAFDRALKLLDVASKLTIITRGKASALTILVQRVRRTGVRVVEEAGRPKPLKMKTGVAIESSKGTFRGDVLLLCVGKNPNTGILPAPLAELDVHPLTGATNVPGLYLAGDAMAGEYRQLGVAVGTGLAAAMSAGRYLNEKYGIPRRKEKWI